MDSDDDIIKNGGHGPKLPFFTYYAIGLFSYKQDRQSYNSI